MPTFTRDQIIKMIEQLSNGQRLVYKLHETFGGGLSALELNPLYPGKKQKKYILRLGKDIELAKTATPFWSSDKIKDVAGWVADRAVEMVEQPEPLKEAI
jgi:hypothetical protein